MTTDRDLSVNNGLSFAAGIGNNCPGSFFIARKARPDEIMLA